MNIAVVKIGNSKGKRLSKTILEKYEIKDTLEVILEKDHIVLKPKSRPRKGWEKAFKKMHQKGDDKLVMPDVFSEDIFEEWK
jgi:antitoxin MazE